MTAGLTDAQVLGLTGWAEARSYLDPARGWRPAPILNMVAVMCTPLNRLKFPKRFGETLADVCLQRDAYSCWNAGSGGNHDSLMAARDAMLGGHPVDDALVNCVVAAQALIEGRQVDVTSGATHYYSPASMVPPGRVPDWAIGRVPVATIGGQLFFKGV